MKKITHVLLSGGGLVGSCLGGIIYYLYLENMLDDIKHIAGNSIGAYFALLLALKIPLEEIRELNIEIIDYFNNNVNIDKNLFYNLIFYKGICSIKTAFNCINRFFIKKNISEKITFKEFSKKFGVNLYISATCLNNSQNKIFSLENTPDTPVLDTIFASMSIPLLFTPIIIDDKCYVDGAISNNFPLDVFKNIDSSNILGVAFNIRSELIKEKIIDNIENHLDQYLITLIKIILKNSNDYCNKSNNLKNILLLENIPIDKVFNIVYNEKNECYKISFTVDDLDNMTNFGFIEMSKYMNKQKKTIDI